MEPPSPPAGVFHPTPARLWVAILLAGLAFLLPQEAPLEWYPLNHPGKDVNLLEITCAADKEGTIRIFYATTRGFNDQDAIAIPITPTRQAYTYTFPLPDAPLTGLQLDPLPQGGGLSVRQFHLINRAGAEIIRFSREQMIGAREIAGIPATADGWKVVSTPTATDPKVLVQLPGPIAPVGMNARNLLRCLLSTGYVAVMLGILLLTLRFIVGGRPAGWRQALPEARFIAILALLFALVANRGLIGHAFRAAGFFAAPPSRAASADPAAPARTEPSAPKP